MASVSDILDALGEAFPRDLAPEGDSSGLLVGSRDTVVSRVLCSIGLDGTVIEEAVGRGCELLVCHHDRALSNPPAPWDADGPAGALARRAILGDLNVVACHAPADLAEGGTADLMAEHLGLDVLGPVLPAGGAFWAKVVVFVPPESLEEVSTAMAGAGAGTVGKYRHCSFRAPGTGTFIPEGGAIPYSGEVGLLNREDEVRLEMRAPSFMVPKVLEAMVAKHPYEEVAYDIYRTELPVPWGAGRIGTLGRALPCGDILEDLAEWSGSARAELYGDPGRLVVKVAVAPGSRGELFRKAYRAGCQLMVVGEMGWQDACEAGEAGMSIISLGDVESELALVPVMVELLERASERGSWGLEVEGCDR